ncbi:hypothetical protein ACQY0O_000854 [Thecaphora frezii]
MFLASSSSAPSMPGHSEAIHYHQLRIHQICSILVRNLTLRPNRDRALRSLVDAGAYTTDPPTTSVDDTDLALRIGRSSRKGKEKQRTTRRRSSSWHRQEDRDTRDDNPSLLASSPDSDRRRSRLDLTADSSLRRRDAEEDLLHSHQQAPRPILKGSTSYKDGGTLNYFSDLAPSASSSFPLGEMGANLLSRSASRSSSKSSSTLMRRPDGRARTISGTSVLSVRSVRFEEQSGVHTPGRRPSTPGASRFTSGSASRLLACDKPLAQIMDERLLTCCVELCSLAEDGPPVELRDGSYGPAAFYTTEVSRGGLHHSWGSLRGAPLQLGKHPSTAASDHVAAQDCLASSRVQLRVWAIKESVMAEPDPGAGPDWKLISTKIVDLRELQRLDGDLADPRVITAPNTLILGLSSSSALSSNGEEVSEETTNTEDTVSAVHPEGRTKDDSQRLQTVRARRLLDQVEYFVVPLDIPAAKGGGVGRADGISASPVGKSAAATSTDISDIASDSGSGPSGVDGNPPAAEDKVLLQIRDRRHHFRTEEKLALERSLRETRMMPSYTLDDAKRVLEAQLALRELKAQARAVHADLDGILGDPQGQISLRMQRNEAVERLRWVREQRDQELRDAAEREEELLRRRAKLEERRQRLKEAESVLEVDRQKAARLVAANAKLKQRVETLSLRVHQRHARLLQTLEDIFPIDLVDGSALLFSIAGIPLPNGVSSCSSSELEAQDKALKALVKAHNKQEDGEASASKKMVYHPLDDDTISTALGLVAQLVILLSSYLATPVHYPMATAGSRAVVQDGISIMSGPRAFPLYARGVERYRYEYAAFLLNKNIEQLMNIHNVTVLDIRHTLPNLKNLVVTVSAAPPASYRSRKRHIGRNEIALISTPAKAEPSPRQENGGVKADGNKKEAIVQLGRGRPQAVTDGDDSWTQPKVVGREAAHSSHAPAKSETLKTTRVLGPARMAPATSDSAIESITKALSFFGTRS